MSLRGRIPDPWRRQIKIFRTKAAERLGSDAFSRPSIRGLANEFDPYLPATGVFLEIGANDGYSASNTYHLERAGWTGILIEPLPKEFKTCRRLRPNSHCFNVACVTDPSGGPILMSDQGLMSVALGRADREESRLFDNAKRISVPVERMSNIIDQTPFERITFMTIDVEGAEIDVLGGLDLARHAPDWLLIETDRVEEVGALLAPWLVWEAQLSFHDHLFRRQTH